MKLYRDFQTQEELDAEYDVERSVPDMAGYGTFFERESAAARQALEHRLDVPYGPTLDEVVDLFPSQESGAAAPIVIYLHGGYWKIHTAREYSFVAAGLVPASVSCVIPTYSLCPKVTMDEIVRQARAAVAWTWRNADDFGGDRERIHIVGHSAGAHLAVMCLLADWPGEYGLPADTIKGIWAISGLYDLRPLPFTFVGPSLQLDMAQVIRNSPMLRELPTEAPPVVVTYGGKEVSEFRRQSDDFVGRWQVQGLEGRFFPQPDRDHFSAITDLASPDGILTGEILKFIEAADP